MSSPIATAAMSAASRASRAWRLPRVTGVPRGVTGGRDGTEADPPAPAAPPRVDAPSPGASSLRARPMLHLRSTPHTPRPRRYAGAC